MSFFVGTLSREGFVFQVKKRDFFFFLYRPPNHQNPPAFQSKTKDQDISKWYNFHSCFFLFFISTLPSGGGFFLRYFQKKGGDKWGNVSGGYWKTVC